MVRESGAITALNAMGAVIIEIILFYFSKIIHS